MENVFCLITQSRLRYALLHFQNPRLALDRLYAVDVQTFGRSFGDEFSLQAIDAISPFQPVETMPAMRHDDVQLLDSGVRRRRHYPAGSLDPIRR